MPSSDAPLCCVTGIFPNISDNSSAWDDVIGTVTAKPVLSVDDATGFVKNASSDGCFLFFIIYSLNILSCARIYFAQWGTEIQWKNE